MPGRLSTRKALVTGAAKGIGAAIARAFAGEGASLTIADIDAEGTSRLAGELGCAGAAVDVADHTGVADMVARCGPFDILVNNAGMDQHAFFTDTTPADWDRLLGVNFISVLNCTHAVLPAMQRAGYGRIINISSEAGRLGSKGGAVYAAAKGAVIAFTRSLARENARYAITANVIAPGPIETQMVRDAVAIGGDKLREAMLSATLLRRLGKPEEIAAAAVFLASDEASYITGETLGVSGGMGISA